MSNRKQWRNDRKWLVYGHKKDSVTSEMLLSDMTEPFNKQIQAKFSRSFNISLFIDNLFSLVKKMDHLSLSNQLYQLILDLSILYLEQLNIQNLQTHSLHNYTEHHQ